MKKTVITTALILKGAAIALLLAAGFGTAEQPVDTAACCEWPPES